MKKFLIGVGKALSLSLIIFSVLLIIVSTLFFLLPKSYILPTAKNTAYFQQLLNTDEKIDFITSEFNPYDNAYHIDIYFASNDEKEIVIRENGQSDTIDFVKKNSISNRFFGAIGLSAAIVLLILEVVLIIMWLKAKHIN